MKKHTLLIVDDAQENLNLLANILGETYFLHRARDGAAALKILREHDVHMILTDQRMPGISGVDFLEKAREARPDSVRILITAYPDTHNAIQAINRGQVQRYIAKPFDLVELKLVIAQELERLDLLLANRRMSEQMKRMVDDLFKANLELRNLDRMKDQFLASCSHELKTPLVSGMGYLDLMLSGGLGKFDDRQEKGLKIAQRNLDRLLGLIDNLLALAKARYRPEELKVTRFRLKTLVDECVASLRARSRKTSLEVKVSVPPRLRHVQADEARMHSVITNVLANAEKFTPEKARIEIVVRSGKGVCHVSVADNGTGPEPALGEIGFFKSSSDPRLAGLGIGLMLSRQILQAHGCDIRLERGPRGGAVVRFDLPLTKG